MTEFAAVPARRFAVCIVTHDDAGDIAPCFESIAGLATAPGEVIVADCASTDTSVAAARAWSGRLPVRVLELSENRGFAGGMNAALAAAPRPGS